MPDKKYNPIICALDTKNVDDATKLCKNLQPYIGFIKLGLEFFTKNGQEGFLKVAKSGIPIFLDLKFHDIPNTVAEAISSALTLDVSILTIHTLGGKEMMKAAAKAAKEASEKLNKTPPLLVGVTILTSMNEDDVKEIGMDRKISKQVELLARLAQESGLDGVVCSPHEIELVKSACGSGFKTVVPGVRPKSSEISDQKRVMTPAEALQKGADYLVIGRPITKSDNPVLAAKSIYEECFEK